MVLASAGDILAKEVACLSLPATASGRKHVRIIHSLICASDDIFAKGVVCLVYDVTVRTHTSCHRAILYCRASSICGRYSCKRSRLLVFACDLLGKARKHYRCAVLFLSYDADNIVAGGGGVVDVIVAI